ncbi:MAG: glycosyltransferase, partial [Patescibacteria group bacterium]
VRHLFERFKWPAHKFFLIPPAAEIAPGRSRKPNSNRLLFVGRLVRYKGVDTLLRAVKKLKLPYRLDIVGDGQHGDAWKKLAKKLGLKEHVKFHPFSDWDKLKSFYRDAQLLIHPTRDPEPFGMTIVESLSCGTPVISSKGSGSEWVAGAAGLTFKPNSAKDLKVQIERFLADKDLQEKMQKEAVKRAKTFNHSEWTPKLIQVLQKVVKKG